jgi:kumamolisin
MSRSIIHCLGDAQTKQTLIKSALTFKLHVQDLAEHGLEIIGETTSHDKFLVQHEDRTDLAIFYHTSHSKSQKGIFKSHLHRRETVKTRDITDPLGNTASSLARYYQFPPQQGTAPTIGIISLGGTYKTQDLLYYWGQVLGYKVHPIVTSVGVGGAPNKADQVIVEGDGSDENTLDIEIAGGVCPQAKIVVYFGRNTTRGFYDTIHAAVNDKVYHPSIISISWGGSELSYTTNQLKAYDQLFADATRKGIIITVASGDNGSSDGVGDGRPHCDFPASSPHVIACGGTKILPDGESAWSWNPDSQTGGGGGISNHFTIPSFQSTVVYNIKKRAIPDLSLNADPASGWTIYFNGQLNVNAWGGTSCVPPAVAGFLGLMNLRYKSDFNTALYSSYHVKGCFRDIVSGDNDKYKASPGFDLCTGLGSVNGTTLFQELKKYAR